MSWFNKNYNRRQIVGVNHFGGSGVQATIDIEFSIPADWDTFWDEIRSDFRDVVVTDPKGNVLSFARKGGANYSDRILILQVDGYVSNNDNSMNAIFVYYGFSSETSDRSVAVTIASPKEGYITLERPISRIVPSRGGQSATDTPIISFSKATIEEVDVFFLTVSLLGRRYQTYNNRNNLEAIDYVEIFSYDNTGTNSATRYDLDDVRLGNTFFRGRYIIGDDGSDYAVVAKFTTTEKQILETRAILRVKNLLPE
tara:strand:+ start:1790 stop:2554 length:765 start_codon:yes stop_codon:yes gene_type:complete